MIPGTSTAYRSDLPTGRDGFAQLLHAEWTKLRTVRGWVIGLLVAAALTVGVGLLTAAGSPRPPARSSRGSRRSATPSASPRRRWGPAANR